MAGSKSRSMSIRQLSDYVQRLANHGKAEPGNVLAESYVAELNNADKQQGRWRQNYYVSRGFVILASAIITALTGFNLHGEAAFALRLTILVLSASVTVITGLLELLQVNHRWRLYRQLRSRLETLGWQTAMQGGEPAKALANLGTGLISAMHEFETHYMSQVAASSEPEQPQPDAENGAAKATSRRRFWRRK
jgi:hypothetical protein